jgi:hypothetical protein
MQSSLTEEEIVALTGYAQPERQLNVLKARGFTRAYRSPNGRVVVERPHFESVSSGLLGNVLPSKPNLSFFRIEK